MGYAGEKLEGLAGGLGPWPGRDSALQAQWQAAWPARRQW